MPKRARWLGRLLLSLYLPAITACVAGRPPSNNILCFTCTEVTCEPAAPATCGEPPGQQTGTGSEARFISGELDLTGDGVPELVRRVGTQVRIEGDGGEVWRTPPNWDVVDVALGDPNDDGRGELLLAFRREDNKGISRSHPFIVGYREGTYRTLWGGSAVRDPIHEVALDDLDGDGVQELVVLESCGEDSRAVTVWRWHGWGFSLQWRSEPGAYSDLVLVSGGDGLPASIRVTRVP
ncbi:MAG: hypothetical protein J7M39_14800 [Anaerolineae bacterium]|nr:hypothetical protein [Anaerolineae bacterium]